MRLINVKTRQMEEFIGNEIPKYAILSHTWEEDEVLFAQYHTTAAKDRKGYKKIDYTCKQAQNDGLLYAWVDTCCIDKTSSAELTEAINSMYAWYGKSTICYVYLSDVTRENLKERFAASRWFTRGWTLQELIAPRDIVFYSYDWEYSGTKRTLQEEIHAITKVPIKILSNVSNKNTYSIAQRMSWASNRDTTRVEDTAYSLMGLFSVNMPLLYGEGLNAFTRLQEEIIKLSNDESVFAWGLCLGHPHIILDDLRVINLLPSELSRSPLFASSPKEFELCGEIVAGENIHSNLSYSLSNQGLEICLPIIQNSWFLQYGTMVALLHCFDTKDGQNDFIGIPLHSYDHTFPSTKIVSRKSENSVDGMFYTMRVSAAIAITANLHKITIRRNNRPDELCSPFIAQETQAPKGLVVFKTISHKTVFKVKKVLGLQDRYPAEVLDLMPYWEPKSTSLNPPRYKKPHCYIIFMLDVQDWSHRLFVVLSCPWRPAGNWKPTTVAVCEDTNSSERTPIQLEMIFEILHRRGKFKDVEHGCNWYTSMGRGRSVAIAIRQKTVFHYTSYTLNATFQDKGRGNVDIEEAEKIESMEAILAGVL